MLGLTANLYKRRKGSESVITEHGDPWVPDLSRKVVINSPSPENGYIGGVPPVSRALQSCPADEPIRRGHCRLGGGTDLPRRIRWRSSLRGRYRVPSRSPYACGVIGNWRAG